MAPLDGVDAESFPDRPAGARARGPLLSYALLAAALACGDGPTDPTPARLEVSEAVLAAAVDGTSDAGSRIAPNLDAASGAGTLATRLNELASRLATRDRGAIAQGLERARAALDAADANGPAAEDPDREAIRLTLLVVQQLLAE